MSYTVHDAWENEKKRGDWPFERWVFPRLELRAGANYFGAFPCPPMHWRLRNAFGEFYKSRSTVGAHQAADEARLRDALSEAEAVVESALEQSESEAYVAWQRHEVWLPVVDESICAGDEPAEMFIDCLALVGPDKFSGQELCAAVGLWCYGQVTLASKSDPWWAELLQQAALALAEAEWYRGKAEQEALSARRIAKQNKAAADKGHARNRKRKLAGLALWSSRSWKVQADAERAIANECHITKEVAGRWIREFKRARK